MYQLKLHPKIEDDLKELDNSLQIQVFKKLIQIQNSPEIGVVKINIIPITYK